MIKVSLKSLRACLQLILVFMMVVPQPVLAMPAAAPVVVRNQGDVALNAALTLIDASQWQAALEKLIVAQKFYHYIGSLKSESIAWRNIGLVKVALGDNDGALAAYKTSLALGQRMGLADLQAKADVGLGRIYLTTQQNDLALQSFQAALKLAQIVKDGVK